MDNLAKIETVAVVGLGLMGASVCSAVRKYMPELKVLGFDVSAETVQGCIESGYIQAGNTVDNLEDMADADLIVLAAPIPVVCNMLESTDTPWPEECLITDISSVKGAILESARKISAGDKCQYIGSHPMAGKEHSGYQHAAADLFCGAVVFLTRDDATGCDAYETVKNFWLSLKAKPYEIDANWHDHLVARASHAVHLIAYSSANAFLDSEDSLLATGGAFRDLTRIAASSPEMWLEIIRANRDNTLKALAEFKDELEQMEKSIRNEEWSGLEELMHEAQEKRCHWFNLWSAHRDAAK